MAKTILIVDDSASLRQVVRIALAGAGYEVIEAVDGQNGLEVLKARSGRKVHLIISDMNMPNMDGLRFAQELKKFPEHMHTPVVMLTTESEAEKMRQGLAVGARAWVVKPFQPAQLLSAVATLVAP